MIHKVLTLVLMLQITCEGKLMKKRDVMHDISYQPNNSIGQENSRKARQFGVFNNFFGNNHHISHQNTHHKSLFSEVMNLIRSTPDYGLKYTEEQPRSFKLLSFPGFHNLIEVKGPTRYRYVPSKLKDYHRERIQKINKMLESPYRISPKFFKYQPKKAYQLDDASHSEEGVSYWENSHESYKQGYGSDLRKNKKQSTPLLKFHQRRKYVPVMAEMTPITCNPNVAPTFTAPHFFQRINPFPFKEVKTRHQEPESDEDDDADDERSQVLESH